MKQRWRKTKNTKSWLCDFCQDLTIVNKDHKPEICCDGYMCGCYGMVNNPVLCKKCSNSINFDAKLRSRKLSKRGLHNIKVDVYLP
ncbi:hypothetical protein COF68_06040 [Bacillus toyonensis]|nr:hypothetical protein COF68_06040 [Bacillus toyonensis]